MDRRYSNATRASLVAVLACTLVLAAGAAGPGPAWISPVVSLVLDPAGGGAPPAPMPAITSVMPPGAGAEITVTLSGTGFGASRGSGGITVSGIAASIETWADTTIAFTMPAGVATDTLAPLTVTNDGGKTATTSIDIPPPNVMRITADNDMDHYPCWGPGGSHVWFSTTRFGGANWEIARIPSGGGVVQRATYDNGADFYCDVRLSSGELAWSSTRDHLGSNTDGDFEVLTGFRAFLPGGITTINIATTNDSRDLDPAWAPKVHAGYDLAWTHEVVDPAGRFVKWTVVRRGTGTIEEVTEGRQPSFSPNGQWMVYSHQGDLYKIQTTGGTPVQLTATGRDTYPHWGANDRIVFQRYGSTTASEDIYVMNADGTDVQTLVATRSQEYHPSWSPDASRVAFHAHRSSQFDIYVVAVP
jgi:hypothetical protein